MESKCLDVEGDVNPHSLRKIEGTFSLDAAQFMDRYYYNLNLSQTRLLCTDILNFPVLDIPRATTLYL